MLVPELALMVIAVDTFVSLCSMPEHPHMPVAYSHPAPVKKREATADTVNKLRAIPARPHMRGR